MKEAPAAAEERKEDQAAKDITNNAKKRQKLVAQRANALSPQLVESIYKPAATKYIPKPEVPKSSRQAGRANVNKLKSPRDDQRELKAKAPELVVSAPHVESSRPQATDWAGRPMPQRSTAEGQT